MTTAFRPLGVLLGSLLLEWCCLPLPEPPTADRAPNPERRAPIAEPAAQQNPLPSTPLTYGFFTVSFAGDGTFSLQGTGWPTMAGTWKAAGEEVTISTKGGPRSARSPGVTRSRSRART